MTPALRSPHLRLAAHSPRLRPMVPVPRRRDLWQAPHSPRSPLHRRPTNPFLRRQHRSRRHLQPRCRPLISRSHPQPEAPTAQESLIHLRWQAEAPPWSRPQSRLLLSSLPSTPQNQAQAHQNVFRLRRSHSRLGTLGEFRLQADSRPQALVLNKSLTCEAQPPWTGGMRATSSPQCSGSSARA